MAKAHWIVKQNEDGEILAASVRQKGKVYHCSPVRSLSTVDEISGRIELSLESPKAVVLVDEFPRVKKEILHLQLQNRLEQLALFNVGEQVSTPYLLLEERHQQQLLSVVAHPESLTRSSISSMTAGSSRQLNSCVPAAAAVAALLGQLGPEPFIVLYITRISGLLLGIRNGALLLSQTVPLTGPAEVDSGVAAHAIGFARQNLEREFDIESCRLVCLGEGRDTFAFEELEEENWIPDWSHCLAAEGNDILLYPGLFGALFTNRNYSLLPPEFRIASSLKKTAAFVAALCVFSGAILLYFGYQDMLSNQMLSRQLAREQATLTQEAEQIRRSLPGEETVAWIQAYLDLVDRMSQEPDAAYILRETARLLPENISIAVMEITREQPAPVQEERETTMGVPSTDPGMPPGEEQGKPQLSAARALLDNRLVTRLECVSTGTYSQVKARFSAATKKLGRRFTLDKVEWNYHDRNKQGMFRCELRLPAQDNSR